MSRIINHLSVIAVGSVWLIGSALGADMTGAEIKALLSGRTTYAETRPASRIP